MKNYLLQLTPEGGPEGTRFIAADAFDVSTGGIVFYLAGDAVAAFSEYELCIEESFIANITEPEGDEEPPAE